MIGSIQQSLVESGVVKEPTQDKAELDNKWIADASFNVFCPLGALPQRKHHVLRCSGVDTPCNITIDGTPVGFSLSEFVTKDFPLRDSLTPTSTVNVTLQSPTIYCQQQYEEYFLKYGYKIESSFYVNGIPNFNFLRKASCSFGWDWGPSVPTLGIKDIGIISYDKGYITDAKCLVGRSDDAWKVRVSAYLEWHADEQPSITADLCEIDENGAIAANIASAKLAKAKDSYEAELFTKDVTEWQVAGVLPAGSTNKIYKVFITLAEEAQMVSRSVGFRTVELVRVADRDETSPPGLPLGESFYLNVNGTPVFAKGSNFIPPNVFDARGANASIQLLKTAVHSGMNCLRVWGGGRYESEEFYSECNRLGLLLWHDFMFACSLYPSHPEFLELVTVEVRQALRRLAGHPCIAIWAGNNENEELLQGIIEGEKRDLKDKLLADYDRLYIETILPTYAEEMKLGDGLPKDTADATDVVVPFWPSSPSNGLDRGGLPGDQRQGDVHYWGVWHGNKPFEAYESVVPRFCSEFGFQSAPSYVELARSLLDFDKDISLLSKAGPHANALNWTSPEMEFLQRSPARGNLGVISQMAAHLRMPTTFVLQVWASQLLQGLAMQKGISTWRRLQPYCMGALYWQLNDIWTGMSWSTVNHSGTWKLSQYFVKRAFATHSLSFKFCASSSTPPAVPSTEDTPFRLGDYLELWLTTDHHEANSGKVMRLVVQAWSLSSTDTKPLIEYSVPDIQLSPESRRVWSTDELKLDKHDVIFRGLLYGEDGTVLAETEHLFLPMKRLNLQAVDMDIKVSVARFAPENGDTDQLASKVSVTVGGNHVALYVSLPEVTKGWNGNWSDNGFVMYPGEPRSVEAVVGPSECILPPSEAEVGRFFTSQTIHVYDSYNPLSLESKHPPSPKTIN